MMAGFHIPPPVSHTPPITINYPYNLFSPSFLSHLAPFIYIAQGPPVPVKHPNLAFKYICLRRSFSLRGIFMSEVQLLLCMQYYGM